MFKLKDWIDQDNINWTQLSENPSEGAIALLENNQDKIYWDALSENPSIFEYDYKWMKDAMYKEFRDWGMDGFEDYEDE